MTEPLVRPDLLQVVTLLDELWRFREPMLRTHLQRASGMNYTLFSRYLEFLLDRDLVRLVADDHGTPWVGLTRRGYEAHRHLVAGVRELYGPMGVRVGDRGLP
ncbi:MAG: hypothetical protein ACREDK_02355 [Thermoplasmata archaeon]